MMLYKPPLPQVGSHRLAILAALASASMFAALLAVGWTVWEWDPAVMSYAIATVIALGFTTYRLVMWGQRPPTLVMFRRATRQLLRVPGRGGRAMRLGQRAALYFVANLFIHRRGRQRWGAHWPIMIGCIMAAAIAFPLIFGWVWFETPADQMDHYRVMAFGIPLRTIPVKGMEAFLMMHGLVWATFPVIGGVVLALLRRWRDRGERALQTFTYDVMPLLALLSIAITGLLLAVSYTWLSGAGFEWIALMHAVTVILTMLWLPFSKLIHVPQRAIKLAQMICDDEATTQSAPCKCARCAQVFASQHQIDDLIEVQDRLGFRYELPTGRHYQQTCPRCRRALVVQAQDRLWNDGKRQDVPFELEATPVMS